MHPTPLNESSLMPYADTSSINWNLVSTGEEGEEVAEGGDDEPGIEHLLMGGRHEEAEEARPGEEGDDEADDDSDPFGHKRRKPKKESDQQMAVKIDEKIAKMEAAAEADQERHLARQPAIYKLKLLAEAEEFLAQKKYHELFISAGGLAVLKVRFARLMRLDP